MKILPSLILLLFVSLIISCRAINPEAADRRMERYLLRNADKVKAAADYSLSIDTAAIINSRASMRKHASMKRKQKRIGETVMVTRIQTDPQGYPDSTVVFEHWSFWGITEVVYDFSKNGRDLNTGRPHYSKINPRIYYSSRPIPMM